MNQTSSKLVATIKFFSNAKRSKHTLVVVTNGNLGSLVDDLPRVLQSTDWIRLQSWLQLSNSLGL